MLHGWLKKIRQEMDLPQEFQEEAPGLYFFPIDEGLTVHIQDAPPEIFFFAEVCEVPNEHLEDLWHHLLYANLFFEGTNGGVLGLDEIKNCITLRKKVAFCSDFRIFHDELEDFANEVEFWFSEIKQRKYVKESTLKYQF